MCKTVHTFYYLCGMTISHTEYCPRSTPRTRCFGPSWGSETRTDDELVCPFCIRDETMQRIRQDEAERRWLIARRLEDSLRLLREEMEGGNGGSGVEEFERKWDEAFERFWQDEEERGREDGRAMGRMERELWRVERGKRRGV